MRVLNPHGRYNRSALLSACSTASQFAHIPIEFIDAACDQHRRPRDLFYFLYRSHGRLCPICRTLEFDDRLAERYALSVGNRAATSWSYFALGNRDTTKAPLQSYAVALCGDFCALNFHGPPQMVREEIKSPYVWAALYGPDVDKSVSAPAFMADGGRIPVSISFYTRDGERIGLLRFLDPFFFEHWNHPFCMKCSRYVRTHMPADLKDENGWLPYVRLLKSHAIAKRISASAEHYRGHLRFDPMRGIHYDKVASISEKIRDGLARARAKGKILGRQNGFCPSDQKTKAVLRLHKGGHSYRAISSQLHLSKNTVMRIVQRHAQ